MNTILNYSAPDIEQLCADSGQPSFRAKQLVQWLYRRGVRSYADMTNLPKSFRAALEQDAPLIVPTVVDRQVSRDGTRKYLLELADGALVETVGIPSRDQSREGIPRRLTVCFSTQVGCPMRCAFCATGREGLSRNLYPGEMAWQILVCQQDFGIAATNAVAMGQGEPFLNFDNLAAALHLLNSSDAIGIGARHISVSTCGIPAGIRRFADLPEQFTLAVSLHSALQDTRDTLMPGCASIPLANLKEALLDYQGRAGRRITFEYLMIQGHTDTGRSLSALVDFCRGLKSHVNLLKVNRVAGSPFSPSTDAAIRRFEASLGQHGIEVTVRDSRGADIDGACGQLKNARAR